MTRNLRVLTTNLTAGECLDRLRRISKRDDGQVDDRSTFEPETLLLAKTPKGFTLRIRGPIATGLSPILDVRFEQDSSPAERLRLVGQMGIHPGMRFAFIVGSVVGIAIFGLMLRSAVAESKGIVRAVPILSCILLWSLLPLLIKRVPWANDSPELFETVRTAVDGDEWRAV